jgi:hypothetical protein
MDEFQTITLPNPLTSGWSRSLFDTLEKPAYLPCTHLESLDNNRCYAAAGYGSRIRGRERYSRTASRMMAALASTQLSPRAKQ